MLWSNIEFNLALTDIRNMEGKQMVVVLHYILNELTAITDYLRRLSLKI
jgi:hypothetical protein